MNIAVDIDISYNAVVYLPAEAKLTERKCLAIFRETWRSDSIESAQSESVRNSSSNRGIEIEFDFDSPTGQHRNTSVHYFKKSHLPYCLIDSSLTILSPGEYSQKLRGYAEYINPE